MSLPRYPQYKEGGKAWLGEVPAHWRISPLKYLASFKSGGTPSKDNLEYWDGDVPWASAKDLKTDTLADTIDHVTAHAVESGNASIVPAGTILVVVRGMILARAFPVSETLLPMAINQDLKGLVPGKNLLPRFLAWLLRGTADESLLRLDEAGHGTKALRMDAWTSMQLPVPPIEEQLTIVMFLDHETRKIDALISEQENLLALLAEKRQATISHAVSRGLNPDAPMKDSGVAWLGDVPAHWEVKQLRYIAKIVRGASPRPAGDPLFFAPDNDDGSNTPWVTVAEVTKDTTTHLESVSEFLTPLGAESSQYFERGTLIFTNSGATLGVPKILAIDCCANDGILAFKNLSPSVESLFLYFFLLTTTDRLRTEMKQGGGQPNLNTDIVKNIFFAKPSTEEQSEIAAFLQLESARLDSLKAEAERAIDLLKERRSALIASAVTGKIDVRNTVPQELAA
ncbi:type I restriction enzyme specificity protein [Burkholderia pseudomallei]|nr:type I restriction enzyme specificity protein [Burkholderia pseudomallei]CAJ4529146.1 type I restriction enzyme specificity protein [Burkholderia pseudomallei]